MTKKSIFLYEKMVLRVVFSKIVVYVVTDWYVRLEKHQTNEFFLWQIYKHF